MPHSDRFARRVFLIAGITGLLELLPLYFLEGVLAVKDPPAINHPNWYYGFIGVAVAFQLVFLMISRDPTRYRPMILPSIVEKVGYVIAATVLFSTGRMASNMLIGPGIDAIWLVLFSIAYLKTPVDYPAK